MFKKEDFDREYGDLVALGKKTGCAHLHDTVPFDQVPSEFAKYDFGLSVVPRADYPGHASRFPKQGGHFAYCGSARNTDYMDAALPTLCSPILHFQHRMLKRYSLEVTYTDELLNDPVAALRPYCNRETRQKVIERRRSYTIDAQTPRLSAFYEKLQTKHGLI